MIPPLPPRRFCALVLPALLAATPALADVTFTEDFADNPVAAGRAYVTGAADLGGGQFDRFNFSSGSVVAHYDSTASTAKLVIPLPVGFNQNSRFSFDATFTINSLNFQSGLYTSQLAFGLINRTSTGDDRTSGDDANGNAISNAYNNVSVDYYPASGTYGPSLSPTLTESPNGPSFSNVVDGPFYNESGLLGDTQVPLAKKLKASVAYDPAGKSLTLRLYDLSGASPTALDINTVGGAASGQSITGGDDGDTTTIRNLLDQTSVQFASWGDNVPFTGFEVNALALTLWSDAPTLAWASWEGPVQSDIAFNALSVTYDPATAIAAPEPATAALLLPALAGLLLRRRGPKATPRR